MLKLSVRLAALGGGLKTCKQVSIELPATRRKKEEKKVRKIPPQKKEKKRGTAFFLFLGLGLSPLKL